jgi:two-component system, cell cycle sensor histidine kinase and response regulator CckA
MPTKSNGYIFADCELDKRSAFKMHLPHTHIASNLDRDQETQEYAAHVTETVLVVDDDNALRNLVSKGLRMRGYRILTAANGLQALQLAERHPGRIDALVTDMIMPYLGGPEVARQLTAIRPQLKVLYMSGCVHDGRDATELPAMGKVLLQKPFTLDELSRKLKEALDHKDENSQR